MTSKLISPGAAGGWEGPNTCGGLRDSKVRSRTRSRSNFGVTSSVNVGVGKEKKWFFYK